MDVFYLQQLRIAVPILPGLVHLRKRCFSFLLPGYNKGHYQNFPVFVWPNLIPTTRVFVVDPFFCRSHNRILGPLMVESQLLRYGGLLHVFINFFLSLLWSLYFSWSLIHFINSQSAEAVECVDCIFAER